MVINLFLISGQSLSLASGLGSRPAASAALTCFVLSTALYVAPDASLQVTIGLFGEYGVVTWLFVALLDVLGLGFLTLDLSLLARKLNIQEWKHLARLSVICLLVPALVALAPLQSSSGRFVFFISIPAVLLVAYLFSFSGAVSRLLREIVPSQ